MQAEQARLREATKLRRAELLRLLQQTDDSHEEESVMHALQQEQESARNFQLLVQNLHRSTGLLARDVGQDGNCGIWAFLALERGNPFLAATSDAYTIKEMQDARRLLADLWTEVATGMLSSDPAQAARAHSWAQRFFVLMPHVFQDFQDAAASADDSDAACAKKPRQRDGNVQSPQTPQRAAVTSADRLEKLYEQHTPPKLTSKARRTIAAGLVHDRSSDGPSVPLAASVSVSSEKIEKIEKSAQLKNVKRERPADPSPAQPPCPPSAPPGLKAKMEDQEDQEGAGTELVQCKPPAKKAKKQNSQISTSGIKLQQRRLHEKKMQAARVYLATIRLASNVWSRVHAKGQVLKGAMTCGNGGWRELLQRLLEGQIPQACSTCTKMLDGASFSLHSFQRAVQDAVAGEDGQASSGHPQHAQESAKPRGEASKLQKNMKNQKIQKTLVNPVKEECKEEDDDDAAVQAGDAVQDVKAEDDEDAEAVAPVRFDVRELVRKNPRMTVLPENSYKRRFPVQCSLCVRSSTKQPAIFDLVDVRKEKFYIQHIGGPTHIKNLALFNTRRSRSRGCGRDGRVDAQESQDAAAAADGRDGDAFEGDPQALVPYTECQSFHLKCAPAGAKLANLRDAFELWATYQIMPGMARLCDAAAGESGEGTGHRYQHDLKSGSFIIRHRLCEGSFGSVVEDGVPPMPMCAKCESLGDDRSILRMLTRFFTKYSAAHLLQAKLFAPDAVDALVEEIRGSDVYRQGFKKELDAVIDIDLLNFQKFVRAQFTCIPKSSWGRALSDLVGSIVQPCLSVSVHSWDAKVACNAQTVASKLKTGSLSSLDDVNLKLACHVASGSLNEHHLVHGVLCAAVEQTLRAQRGTGGMRQLRVSDVEKSLMAEAGITLALAAKNMSVLQQFGLAWTVPRLPLANLHGQNLPDPFVALADPAVLQENSLLIDSLLPPVHAGRPEETHNGLRQDLPPEKPRHSQGEARQRLRGNSIPGFDIAKPT